MTLKWSGAGADGHRVADLLIVPSARLVATELQAEFGPIPPALIPMDGRPAVRYILDSAPAGTRALIAGHDGFEQLSTAVRDIPAADVVDVGATTSLAHTVAAALAHVTLKAGERLVINFADTLVADLPSTGDAIAFCVQNDSYRWTAFVADPRIGIESVVEKGIDKGTGAVPVFSGVFAFEDAPRFERALAQALQLDETAVDPLYIAVATYVRERPAALFETASWYDFGHIDTYYRTRQRLLIDAREFNAVHVDARRGVIRKTSTNTVKLFRERDWYQGLPGLLGSVAPRVFDSGMTGERAFLDMEFYGYPPLADAYLFGAWDTGAWAMALDAVGDVAERLHAEHAPVGDPVSAAVLRAIYVDKTRERLSAVLADDRFAPLRGERVTIDGRECLGLDAAVAILPQLVDRLGLCDPRPLGIVHGDLCLSNILYDRRNGIVRLIDPRGDFGGLALHGDVLYDYAKLAHSIRGDYDHLVRGLFDLDIQDGAFTLDVHVNPYQVAVKQLFDRRLADWVGADAERVELIEALLFLTMVPLHADRPRSQLAFLARGLATVSRLAERALAVQS